jgi:TrmH family RNA methyltransferase
MARELARIRLVLAGPRTPGNVGACARVAANFGCTDWVIAAAQCDWSGWDARKLATGAAREVLDGARSTETLAEAVRDCQIVVGFSRRQGRLRKPTIRLPEIAALPGRVALVFGNEETGLSSEELAHCTRLCALPTSAVAPSMNLSHAVAVVLARVFEEIAARPRAAGAADAAAGAAYAGAPARMAEFEAMLGHWREFVSDVGMRTAGNPERMVDSLRRIFARAGLTPREVRALRGLLSKAQVALGVRRRGRRVL